MNRKFDLVALGEAMVEFNQTVAGQPNYLQGFGGDTSNAVIAAARAGVKTAYLSRLGKDTFGDALIALWAKENVDASAVEQDPTASTGLYFVTHGDTGHDFSYRRAGSAASQMTPAWLSQGSAGRAIRDARILHVSGISLAISLSACDTAFAAMQLARSSGALVSFDSNLRLKLWPLDRALACTRQAISLCDIFLPSLEDITALNGMTDSDQVVDWGHTLGAKQVVLKLGSEGALVSDGSTRERVPAHRVKLVDATGAGDCFCGNLLARIAQDDSIFQAARYANAAAALTVQGYGAVAPLPRPEQVMALL
ncbi:MAG: sugar kinase [Polaromonas sp.]|nr:sugar kinase [Polaromonas sp.]